MARTEARIRCAVWRNREFTSLPLEAQGLYWMLLSQPDVSLAGVVPYNPHKWAHLGQGDVLEALSALEVGGFVMPDPTTGELWIRTFTKHDGVLNGEKTRAGMWSAWTNILSAGIRGRFLEHLEGNHATEALEREWVTPEDLEDARTWLEDAPRDDLSDGVSPGGQDGVSNGVSPRACAESDTASDSDSDTAASAKPPRQPAPPADTTKGDEHGELFAALVDVCGYEPPIPGPEGGKIGKCAKSLREIGVKPEDVYQRAKAYRQRWPDIDLTPTGLVGNWAQVVASKNGHRNAPTSPDACQQCGQGKSDHDAQLCKILAEAS